MRINKKILLTLIEIKKFRGRSSKTQQSKFVLIFFIAPSENNEFLLLFRFSIHKYDQFASYWQTYLSKMNLVFHSFQSVQFTSSEV